MLAQSSSSWTQHRRNSGTVHMEVAAHLPQLSQEGMVEPHANHLVVIDSGMAETSGGRGQAGMTNEAARSKIWFKGTSAIGNTSGAELERSPTCSALRDAYPGTAGLSQAQEHRPRAPTARLPSSSPKARPSVLRSRKKPPLLRSSSRPTYGAGHRVRD